MSHRKQAISAGHELTLDAAKQILKAGGNAFDAAVAAFAAMFITEPCMASAGGNGFALIKPSGAPIQYLDFFCQTPKNKKIGNLEFYPIVVNFGDEQEEFQIGLGSAAVPGSIAAIFSIHQRYCTMPLKELFAPAKKMAREGVILNEFQALDLFLLRDIFGEDKTVEEIFFKNGEVKKEGDELAMPQMADFLEFIEREGRDGFYKGEIAKQIVKDSIERGGFLRMVDFENYQAEFRPPLNIPYNGKTVSLPNGPSKGGVALSLMLANCGNEIFSVARAIKLSREIMVKPNRIKRALNKYYPNNNYVPQDSRDSLKGTSHFNIIDKDENAICLTSSIGEGCGYFIPGTSMQLNNMLGEIFLLPNGPHSWPEDTRLNSGMTPTMVSSSKNEIEFLSGSGGASRIPYAIGQVIYHLYEKNKTLKEATEHGRFHFQNDAYQVEAGLPWKGIDHKAILWDKKSLYFGGVHSILKNKNGLHAMGDARRFGVAEVF